MYHRKTLTNMSSAMEYGLCDVVKSDSTTEQIGFSSTRHLEIRFAMTNSIRVFVESDSTIPEILIITENDQKLDHINWMITFVLLLRQPQQQHNIDLLLHDH